jgi:hypothetical protein
VPVFNLHPTSHLSATNIENIPAQLTEQANIKLGVSKPKASIHEIVLPTHKAHVNIALNLKYHGNQYNKSNAFGSYTTIQRSGRAIRALGLRIVSFNNWPIDARVWFRLVQVALREPLGQDGTGDRNIGTKGNSTKVRGVHSAKRNEKGLN